ncbi:excinuclease ABC subunit C [Enterococcus faecalis]|uniref:excinuclease ABC subunit C n=1 Tax=Enterococcus faecalis TaxID=1351 RepID=UPI000F813B54|nr:excinuclease ABC subunit C [Enterococcus faecalis]MCC4085279.1 excinuclease ABC subunit C [Enterococcus faecalis]MDG4630486.1 excinuclease ABC subunit C [Enterococcus faecalis]MDG4633403.1 excinuclease ABC subunit C [Enterococcus faecalis]RTK32139.1 excinuclease ABC subunit C [Enterococcus faecalis]
MISLTTITAMEIFMKTYDYQGKLIKEDNHTTSIAYVQCSCGCLASRMSSDSDKFKCSLCKRVYVLKKET